MAPGGTCQKGPCLALRTKMIATSARTALAQSTITGSDGSKTLGSNSLRRYRAAKAGSSKFFLEELLSEVSKRRRQASRTMHTVIQACRHSNTTKDSLDMGFVKTQGDPTTTARGI